MKRIVQQDWKMTDRGHGCEPDGCSLHIDDKEATLFIATYWDKMPLHTPAKYPMPYGDPKPIEVDDETHWKVHNSRFGYWLTNDEMKSMGLKWGDQD